MSNGAPVNLAAPADSSHATELQRAQQHLPFSPDLESEYIRTRLLESRHLIRVTCVLAAILAIVRGIERVVGGLPMGARAIALAFVVIASVAMVFLAWSPAFERRYLPFAHLIVPLRNALVASYMALAVAEGQGEMLIVLPVLLFGPFFFLGLSHRSALFTGVLTATCFIVNAALAGLELPVALRAINFLLITLVGCAVAARHLERLSRTSFLEKRLISRLAEYDTLTGTRNRRVFDEHLARLWQQAAAAKRTMAIFLIDVDHFKAYNDCYGHQAGDTSLRQIADRLQSIVRDQLDVLARYGGEEFVAVLFDIDVDEAKAIAERVRRSVQELGIEHRASRTSESVTISIGVAVVEPSPARTPRGAMQLADQALYAAKISGRNRVRVMNEVDYGMLVTGEFTKHPSAANA